MLHSRHRVWRDTDFGFPKESPSHRLSDSAGKDGERQPEICAADKGQWSLRKTPTHAKVKLEMKKLH